MIACFQELGKLPEVKEKLTSFVIAGRTMLTLSLRSPVGIGSLSQVVEAEDMIILRSRIWPQGQNGRG